VTTIPKRWQPFRTWPSAHLTPRRVVTLLKQAGRRNCAGLAQKISSTLRAEALRQPAPVEHALGVAALGLPALEAELAAVFDQHAQAWIITASPASGPSSGLVCSANSVMTRTVSPTLTRCAVSPGPLRSPVRPGEAVWCYTALVIDAFAGYLVAWECSRSKQTAFVESAIRHHLCTASAGAHQPKPKPTTTHDRPANPPIHTN
jgi:hypothetical protein